MHFSNERTHGLAYMFKSDALKYVTTHKCLDLVTGNTGMGLHHIPGKPKQMSLVCMDVGIPIFGYSTVKPQHISLDMGLTRALMAPMAPAWMHA